MGRKMICWGVLIALLGFAAYVRLAPSEAARWHVTRENAAEKSFAGGAIRRVKGGRETLEKLDEIAMREPRTERLAGAVNDGKITYITRSKLWGFPDYTTIWEEDGEIVLFGRLRFGRSDMGVNGARLARWISQL